MSNENIWELILMLDGDALLTVKSIIACAARKGVDEQGIEIFLHETALIIGEYRRNLLERGQEVFEEKSSALLHLEDLRDKMFIEFSNGNVSLYQQCQWVANSLRFVDSLTTITLLNRLRILGIYQLDNSRSY